MVWGDVNFFPSLQPEQMKYGHKTAFILLPTPLKKIPWVMDCEVLVL